MDRTVFIKERMCQVYGFRHFGLLGSGKNMGLFLYTFRFKDASTLEGHLHQNVVIVLCTTLMSFSGHLESCVLLGISFI